MCLEIYQLDPSHFVSAPGASWEACFKKTNVKLELLTDNDTFLMIEKRIRGRICRSAHRYAEANNKYTKDYNPDNESLFLEYQDANNLYGYAMSKKLPIDEFKWSENLSLYAEEYIKNYNEDSDYSAILEVDVHYAFMLWREHRDLPLLPTREKIDGGEKLITRFGDRKKYVVHIAALKQALNHGLKLKKVH